MKPKLAVSACLLGQNCKYNGSNNFNKEVLSLSQKYELIPICPESLGGLKIPRVPAERVGDKVMLKDGTDVTENFKNGAEISLDTALKNGCKMAVLKARSPSCGVGLIYNGKFNGALIDGNGVTAELFKKNGILLFTEEDIKGLL